MKLLSAMKLLATVNIKWNLTWGEENIQKNINLRVSNASNGETMISSKSAKCGIKKSRFIKNQEAKELLNSVGLRTPLSKLPLLGNILF